MGVMLVLVAMFNKAERLEINGKEGPKSTNSLRAKTFSKHARICSVREIPLNEHSSEFSFSFTFLRTADPVVNEGGFAKADWVFPKLSCPGIPVSLQLKMSKSSAVQLAIA